MIKEKPLVTIITSSFNLKKAGREKMFRQSLESIHGQTYKNIEHIVIDGASNDGTLDLLNEYSDKGWITYVSEPDRCIYDAMNKGVMLAKGKYIAFVNSDDFYHNKNGVEISVNALEENGAVFSYAPVINFDEKSGVKEVIVPDISKIFFSIVPNHQTMLVRRQAILDEGLFDVSYRNLAEYDLHIKFCLKKYKSVFVQKDFVTYRLGGNSYVASKKGLIFEEVSDIYLKNYNKLCPLSKEECEKICGDMYYGDYGKVPLKLAKRLREFKPYFNYGEYVSRVKPTNRVKEKGKLLAHRSYRAATFFWRKSKSVVRRMTCLVTADKS